MKDIVDYLTRRGVEHLVHFTPLSNLTRIQREGLVPRSALDSGDNDTFLALDELRLDGRKEMSCFSLSFPNFKMMYHYRRKLKEEGSDVALLFFPVTLLSQFSEEQVLFHPTNAASNDSRRAQVENLRGLQAVQALFPDEAQTRAGHLFSRSSVNLPSYLTTDPQAEVQISATIAWTDVSFIVVNGWDRKVSLSEEELRHPVYAKWHVENDPELDVFKIPKNGKPGSKKTRCMMANRPVFVCKQEAPFVSEVGTDFVFHPGFSVQQKQRSVASLHEAFFENHPGLRVLEISSKSDCELGVRLSAFNLMIKHADIGEYSVESAFQSSKVFDRGGPFQDLLNVPSREAKRDSRLRESGALKSFKFISWEFPLEPKTYFYDWLYASALWRNEELLREVVEFDAFTDIEYNPKRSINCQARSVAKVVGLWRRDLLAKALETPNQFLTIGYSKEVGQEPFAGNNGYASAQESLF